MFFKQKSHNQDAFTLGARWICNLLQAMESGRISHKILIKQGLGFHTVRWDELVLFMEGISVKIKRRNRYNLQ